MDTHLSELIEQLSPEHKAALVERELGHVRGEVIQVGAMAIAALAECPDLRAS